MADRIERLRRMVELVEALVRGNFATRSRTIRQLISSN